MMGATSFAKVGTGAAPAGSLASNGALGNASTNARPATHRRCLMVVLFTALSKATHVEGQAPGSRRNHTPGQSERQVDG